MVNTIPDALHVAHQGRMRHLLHFTLKDQLRGQGGTLKLQWCGSACVLSPERLQKLPLRGPGRRLEGRSEGLEEPLL